MLRDEETKLALPEVAWLTSPATANAAIAANAIAPARPGSARTLATQPWPRVESGNQLRSNEFESSGASLVES